MQRSAQRKRVDVCAVLAQHRKQRFDRAAEQLLASRKYAAPVQQRNRQQKPQRRTAVAAIQRLVGSELFEAIRRSLYVVASVQRRIEAARKAVEDQPPMQRGFGRNSVQRSADLFGRDDHTRSFPIRIRPRIGITQTSTSKNGVSTPNTPPLFKRSATRTTLVSKRFRRMRPSTIGATG